MEGLSHVPDPTVPLVLLRRRPLDPGEKGRGEPTRRKGCKRFASLVLERRFESDRSDALGHQTQLSRRRKAPRRAQAGCFRQGMHPVDACELQGGPPHAQAVFFRPGPGLIVEVLSAFRSLSVPRESPATRSKIRAELLRLVGILDEEEVSTLVPLSCVRGGSTSLPKKEAVRELR